MFVFQDWNTINDHKNNSCSRDEMEEGITEAAEEA